jgi:hypothetical protein
LGKQKCGHAHLIYGNMASVSEPAASEGAAVRNLLSNAHYPGKLLWGFTLT